MMYAYVILVQYGVLLSTIKQSNCIILWEMYVVVPVIYMEYDGFHESVCLVAWTTHHFHIDEHG